MQILYPDTIKFNGSDKYLPANGTGEIVVVAKVPVIISVDNVTAYPNTEITVPINVTTEDNKTFSGNISITFPDGSNQTVEIINGTGNATWIVPKDYNPAKYNVTAEFEGNNKYLPSNGTGFITVILVDVQLDVSVDKSIVNYGDVVEFTVTVYNNGPGNATEVIVENIIPEGFIYIADNCTDDDYQTVKQLLMVSDKAPSYDASTGVWYIGDLATGQESKLAILAYADFLGTKHINSSVSIQEVESDYSNNIASVSVTVRPIVDLELVKTVDKTKINAGDEVTYTFTVTNNGPNDATDVKVTDSGLTKFEFVSASSDDYDQTTGVWTVGNLTNGSSVSLTVTVIIDKIGTYPNTAGVSSNENDTNMSNNNATSKEVTVLESEPEDGDDDVVEENATGIIQKHGSKVSGLPETGNPVFMALLVLVTLILLPLRRRL